ncbi:MAG: hypothetical protein FWH47_08145 [Methanomassiliicoccaceae archaeon]|nr:hypothetical protein [Methanomassiliicoccaceae archaeon]
MAEESFYDLWEITTQEEVDILLRAFEKAEKREPEEPIDVIGMIEEGKRLLGEGFLRERYPHLPKGY